MIIMLLMILYFWYLVITKVPSLPGSAIWYSVWPTFLDMYKFYPESEYFLI